ncbi:MAG: hypothetical protein ACHQ53_02290 [Polyangiales bacterium]
MSASGGAGSTGANGTQASSGTVVGNLPCAVANVVKPRCGACHGATPIAGAPMPLVTVSDFQADYVVKTTQPVLGQTIKVYDLALMRINAEMGTPRMPEGGQLAAPELATMNDWLMNGALAGDVCTTTAPPGGSVTKPSGGMPTTGNPGMPGSPGTPGTPDMSGGGMGTGDPTTGMSATDQPIITPDTPDECANDPTQFDPLVALPGETCYEFLTHGVSSATDTTKFTVQTGQSYNQFYYAIPWPKGTLATRFGAKFDNLQVLHHWLGFGSQASVADGTVETNVLGTTLGESAELIGGWAVGGCNVVFPPDMGLKLPDTGKIMIQWHHFNSTGKAAQDGTAVQWCTVPENARANIGGLTFLGTEYFNGIWGMPAGQVSNFSGTCSNDSGKPITIVGFYPHMHLLGVNMKSEVMKAKGGSETVFDHPFVFDHQVNYMLRPGYVLQPGDKITSTCTFDNTTTANVAFGQSTMQEMCYQFTFAYPYGALNNGVVSLIGATNTCW